LNTVCYLKPVKEASKHEKGKQIQIQNWAVSENKVHSSKRNAAKKALNSSGTNQKETPE